jgi:hypothetical protein
MAVLALTRGGRYKQRGLAARFGFSFLLASSFEGGILHAYK